MTSTMASLAATAHKSGNAAAIAPPPGQQSRTSMTLAKDDAMPQAIYVRLSDEMLRQLKSSNAMGPLALELDMGATPSTSSSATLPKSSQAGSVRNSVPTSINVGNKRFQLQPHLHDPASSGSSGSSARRNDMSTTLLECDATSSSRNAALPLQSIASSSRQHYVVAQATQSGEAPVKERTAANMGERIRERAQQLEKEKKSRKIVLVDDEGPLGSKGKKKTGKSSAGSRANPLIKSNSVNPTRSGSPAVVSARASPSLGPTALLGSNRPPNRLVASEAAKDLIKKQQNEQKLQPAAEAKPSATPAILAIQESAVQSEDDKHEVKTKAIGDIPKANSASTTREIKKPSSNVAQPEYHQSKVDMDDLASASSSDEDDSDADRLPLAVRTASPVKSTFAEAVQGGTVSMVTTSVVQPRAQFGGAKPTSKAPSSRDSLSSSGSSAATASPQSAAAKVKEDPKATKTVTPQMDGAAILATKSKNLHASPSLQPQDLSQPTQVRAKSPAGRSSSGGPRAVAKTSGGSRLSKPVPKRSPRTSPGPAAAPQSNSPPKPDEALVGNAVAVTSSLAPSENLATTSNIPTTSISRPPSPKDAHPPAHTFAHKSSSNEITLAVGLQPSRTPSPSTRSPSHPLPSKPPPSPGHARPGAAPRSVSRQSTPSLPSANAVQAGVSSVTNGSSATQGDRLRPTGISLPSSLPANPITGVTPSIPRSPVSSAPVSRQPSVSASSPIVSTFSKSREAATGSPRSSKTLAATDLDSRHQEKVKRKERLEDSEDKNRSWDHRKRQKLAASESEEEGEYQPSSGSRARQASKTQSETGSASKQHPAVPDLVDGNVAAARDDRAKVSSGLPSFTKKGRMSELMPSGRRDSRPTSQAGSRANTPISYAMDTDEESSPAGKGHLNQPRDSHGRGAGLRITTDNDFIRYSQDFEKRLFPEYSRLYRDLEDLKSSLSSNSSRDRGKSRPEYTVQKVARLVEDVNERAAELESIKHALEVYNNRKARHGDTQPIMV